jgi:hypothetical protein
MTTIFIDECGFSGEDLTNEDQPVFTLASLNLDEQACREIKQHFFGDVRAKELKHSRLSRYPRQQQMVVNFMNYLKDNQDITKIGVAHKRFALVCKLVDLIVEPVTYEDGIDLYAKGANIALSHLFFYTMPAFGSPFFFSDLLTRFQEMIRSRSMEAYYAFFDLVFQEYKQKELNELLGYLRPAHYRIGPQILEDIPENSLDIAFSHALLLMAMWRREISGPIILIHDASSNMRKEKHIWDALVDPSLPPVTVGYDRRRMTFPIAVDETHFERSEHWVGLQLTDVIAGATTRAVRWLTGDQGAEDSYSRMLASIINEIPVLPIWPRFEFTPQELGTTGENAGDPVEYMMGVIRSAGHGSHKSD